MAKHGTVRRVISAVAALLMLASCGPAATKATAGGSIPPGVLSAVTNTRPASVDNTLAAPASNRADPRLRRIGFRSSTKLHEHFAKHGGEFGNISEDEYLRRAQALRDAPVSKQVIETTQPGGTLSRFDRSSGSFIAFDTDLTIRTFFRPNDGENYFWRAAGRRH